MLNDCQNFPTLTSQSRLHKEGRGWQRTVLSDIEARLGDDADFPCLFSKKAFQKGLLKFIFVDNVEANGIYHLAQGLKDYVELSIEWNGSLNTAYPLIVAFSLDVVKAQSVEDYHAFGWKVLQKLHELDSAPWPAEVSKDPNAPSWSMCFNGMPLFCNMSHPAHRVRRSRNLGRHFLIVINPRERFDVVAGNNPNGRKVRSNIRKRIVHYDGVPHCLQLASYEDEGVEWWQYGIIEENVVRRDKCPFHFVKT